NGNVRLAQIHRLKRRLRKLAFRISGQPRQQLRRWIAKLTALELRKLLGSKDRHLLIKLIQLFPQFSFGHQRWPFDQIVPANSRDEECLTPGIADHAIVGRVAFDRADRRISNQMNGRTTSVSSGRDRARPSKEKSNSI